MFHLCGLDRAGSPDRQDDDDVLLSGCDAYQQESTDPTHTVRKNQSSDNSLFFLSILVLVVKSPYSITVVFSGVSKELGGHLGGRTRIGEHVNAAGWAAGWACRDWWCQGRGEHCAAGAAPGLTRQ